jgi:thioredoxin 1
VVDVTDESFDRDVLSAGRPVVVDFWAPWCGPCHAIVPVLEQLEHRAEGRVTFAKVNVDLNPGVASRFGVLALPTTILFADGEAQRAVVGARSASHYEREWATWLTPAG